jgi:hypothetical protein
MGTYQRTNEHLKTTQIYIKYFLRPLLGGSQRLRQHELPRALSIILFILSYFMRIKDSQFGSINLGQRGPASGGCSSECSGTYIRSHAIRVAPAKGPGSQAMSRLFVRRQGA